MSTLGDVQYIGGTPWVHWGCSVHRKDTMGTSRGYHEYIGGCSVPWRDIMIHVGDTMSTSEDIMSTSGGYHEYIRGRPVHWVFNRN